MSDRHKAPRRQVHTVARTTGYGQSWWIAALECGHTERRKKHPAKSLGCTHCLKEERSLAVMLRMPSSAHVAIVDDPSVEASLLCSVIAERLDLPAEFVSAHIEGLQISGFMAWIPYHAATLMSTTNR
jgi:hypothetical protein